MKIYTRTGDDGQTGLFGGPRVAKDHVRIEAYGTVDELNALIGLVRAEGVPGEISDMLSRIQNDLFAVGAELATPDADARGTKWIAEAHVESLENDIDSLEQHLPVLNTFILPGGSRAAATAHVARVVCRRAERRFITMARQEGLADAGRLIRYLNRLGDLLFVVARAINAAAGQADVAWSKPDPAE